MDKSICGRTGRGFVGGDRRGGRILREEDTVCCATITIFYARPTVTTIVQKAAKDNVTVKQKLATIVLDKRRWRRSEVVFTKISSDWSTNQLLITLEYFGAD